MPDPVVKSVDGREIRVNPTNSKFYTELASGRRFEARTIVAVERRLAAEKQGVDAFWRERFEGEPAYATAKHPPVHVVGIKADKHGQEVLIDRDGDPIRDCLYVWDEQRIAQLAAIEAQLTQLQRDRRALFEDWPPFTVATLRKALAEQIAPDLVPRLVADRPVFQEPVFQEPVFQEQASMPSTTSNLGQASPEAVPSTARCPSCGLTLDEHTESVQGAGLVSCGTLNHPCEGWPGTDDKDDEDAEEEDDVVS